MKDFRFNELFEVCHDYLLEFTKNKSSRVVHLIFLKICIPPILFIVNEREEKLNNRPFDFGKCF